MTHPDVTKAYDRYQESIFLRQGQARGQFDYAGIVFEEYRGSIGGVDFIADGKAHFFPVGTPGLFRQYNAPADFVETVNTIGLANAGDELLSKRTDPESGILRAFKNYEKGATDTASAIETAFTVAMKATEDAIVNMVTSGKISLSSLGDFADSIVADITRMFVQKSITGPLFKALSGSMESGGFLDSIMSALSFHEGGTVGETSARLMVPSYVFAGAPRYHGGGIAGLKSDEVPAILQRGEEVISRKDRKSRSAGVSVVMHITTPDANSFRASQSQISAEAARGINRAKRNL